MEYTHPEKIRVERLKKVDRRLTIIFVIILGLLSIFFFKFLLSSIISVERAGIPLNSVVDVIKYHFLAFFDSFGDLTCKYMLFVSLLLFINVVVIAANKFFRVFESRWFFLLLFAFSVVAAFSLPLDKIFLNLSKGGKTGLLVFCLILMIPAPYLLGWYLSKSATSSLIISKTFYVIIYGLLLIQLIIEW